MSDNNKDSENKNAGQEDVTKLKETVGNLQKTNTQILEALNAMKTAAVKSVTKKEEPKTTGKDLKDVWFDDQEAAAQIITDRAEQRIQQALAKQQEVAQATNSVMRVLYKDYPELADLDHPLTQKAIEIFDKLSEDEKRSPLAYKLAVRDAADELEIKVKTKRKTVDDDDAFSLGGNGSRGNSDNGGKKKSTKLDPRTVEFAKLMGLNMDDEKTVKRVQERAQRDTWMKYR